MLRKKHLSIVYSKYACVYSLIPAYVLIENHTNDI